jgi:diguanylate cyclase (GGDEF)-like protein
MEKLPEADRLRLVIDAHTEIAKSRLNLEGVMRQVLDSACRITGAEAAVVETTEGDELVTRAASGSAEQFIGLRLPAASSMSGLCVETGQVLRSDDTMSDPRADREACLAVGAVSMICVPLRLDDGDIAGVLKAHSPALAAFDDADEETLTLLSGLIVAGLANAHEQATLRDESRRDTLTGLGNRRSYDEALVREAARAVRYGSLLSLVLFDVDGFKGVNDRFGHQRGDAVLAEVGRLVASGRTADLGYRVGGDEFALILPETGLDNAEAVGRRVADAVAASIQIAGQATVSVGAAEARSLDPRALHAEADAALYRAKQVRAESMARKIERRWLRAPEETRRSSG